MTPLTQALNTALIHFIWQGIVVSLLLWIVFFLLRRGSASARYAASCSALALLALAPVVTALSAYIPQDEARVSSKAIAFMVVAGESGRSVMQPAGIMPGFHRLEGWIL